jgi:hypothetical protein
MAKSRKKMAVPKKVAGVKVPKPVRRAVKALARSQNGRAVIAEALLAAGTALAAATAAPAARKTARTIKDSNLPNVAPAMAAALASFTDTLRGRSSPASPEAPKH